MKTKEIITELKSQFYTWDEVKLNIKSDWVKMIKAIKNFFWKIYCFFDRGNPKWIEYIKTIKPFKQFRDFLQKRKFYKFFRSFLPDYVDLSYSYIFLHTSSIPEGSDAIREFCTLIDLLQLNGFKKMNKASIDEDSYKMDFRHKKYGWIYLHVFMDNNCDIEYVEEKVKKTKIAGYCKKILDEINEN